MLEQMVLRLGHRPIPVERPTPAQLRSADMLLVETAAPQGVSLARTARAANPSLAIVRASVESSAPGFENGFADSLVKPFGKEDLAEAIEHALGRERVAG